MKILVVEDDASLRHTIGAKLDDSGIEVIEVASGEAAIAAVESADELGLILMDMRLPGLGGAKTCAAIRALPGWRGSVQIMAMSGVGSHSPDTLKIFDGFLPKGPEFFEALLGVIAARAGREHDFASEAPHRFAPSSEPPEPPEPPHSTLVSWLRLNLSLTIFIMSLVSGGIGALVTGTLRVARYDARLEALENAKPETFGPRVTVLEENQRRVMEFQSHEDQDRAERDRRRLQLANDLGAINSHISALDAQAKWVGDFVAQLIRERK